jgi:long-chain acyl-CoA synthetase
MSDGNTLPRLLARNAAQWPQRPAWRHKRLGIWQTQTWLAFANRTNDIAHGLAANGFARFDRLVVIGDNHPELYAALLAAQILGGIGVPLDPDAPDARLSGMLEDSAAAIVIADTIDQAERVLSLAQALPSSARIYCADAGGFHRHGTWEEQSLDRLVADGEADARNAASGRLHQAKAHGTPQDLALLLYAVGDTPPSNPLSLSHAQLITAAQTIAAADPVHQTDEVLSYLPMASYEDALYSLTLGLLGGFACNCPEAPDSVLRDLREIGPTILFAPSPACVALAQSVAAKADAATGIKRRSFAFFQRLAMRAETLREQGRTLPLGLSIGCRIGEMMAYAPARDQLGLNRARWVHADAPVPLEAARLLRALGIALRAGAGRTVEPAPVRELPETQHV